MKIFGFTRAWSRGVELILLPSALNLQPLRFAGYLMIFTHPLDVKQRRNILPIWEGLWPEEPSSRRGSDGISLFFNFRRNGRDLYFRPEEGVSFSL